MEFYADKFKTIRKQKKLSLKNVAEILNINWQTVWNWENRKIIPAEAKIRHLCNCLEIEVNQISDIHITTGHSFKEIGSISELWSTFANYNSIEVKHEKIIINELHKLSSAFNQSAVLLNALLVYNSSLIYIKDITLNYIAANKAFNQNLSLSENYDVSGKKDDDFFSVIEADKNTSIDLKAIDTGEPVTDYEDFIPGSRKQRWGLFSKIPLINNKGKVTGLLGYIVDITERRKREIEQNMLNSMLEKSQEVFWAVDLNGKRIISVSGNIENISGKDKKYFIGKAGFKNWISNYIHPEDKEFFIERLEQNRFSEITQYRILDSKLKEKIISPVISKYEINNMTFISILEREITNRHTGLSIAIKNL